MKAKDRGGGLVTEETESVQCPVLVWEPGQAPLSEPLLLPRRAEGVVAALQAPQREQVGGQGESGACAGAEGWGPVGADCTP